jgi:hypothetical protein
MKTRIAAFSNFSFARTDRMLAEIQDHYYWSPVAINGTNDDSMVLLKDSIFFDSQNHKKKRSAELPFCFWTAKIHLDTSRPISSVIR